MDDSAEDQSYKDRRASSSHILALWQGGAERIGPWVGCVGANGRGGSFNESSLTSDGRHGRGAGWEGSQGLTLTCQIRMYHGD